MTPQYTIKLARGSMPGSPRWQVVSSLLPFGSDGDRLAGLKFGVGGVAMSSLVEHKLTPAAERKCALLFAAGFVYTPTKIHHRFMSPCGRRHSLAQACALAREMVPHLAAHLQAA